jgi:hypothetical protein
LMNLHFGKKNFLFTNSVLKFSSGNNRC